MLLYFRYANCPDHCPTTLSNVADILHRLGPVARRVRMLFITVDPNRDTLPVSPPTSRISRRRSRGCAGPGPARDVGAALSCGLLGDPGKQGPPLRSDPQLGHLCVRRLGCGAADRRLARLNHARHRRHDRGFEAAGRRRTAARAAGPAAAPAIGHLVTSPICRLRCAPGSPRSRSPPRQSAG